MTDRQIELVLARSARKIRKGGAYQAQGGGGKRFSIIGEEGAGNLDFFSKQNNLDNLAVAKEMLESGKDARAIKLATGWEKGGDGKWRMEVPDIEMKKTKLFLGREEKIHPPVKFSGFLKDIVDAPELFEAYPKLKDIVVTTTDELPKGVAGRFYTGRISLKDNTTPLQLDNIRRLNRQIQRTENWTEKDTLEAQMLRLESDPVKVRENARKTLDLIANVQLYEYRLHLIHEIQHAIQDIEGFASGGSSQDMSFSEYRNLAGEVEARNAARRAKLSAEEKRNSLLAETEDVAEDSKIYLFENDGESSFAEPFTDDQKRRIASMAHPNGVDVVKKILYGGSITRNGNTVHFDGKNSHPLKLHLEAPGFNPQRGVVTIEEIEKFLPLALAQEAKIEKRKNKKGKITSNKIYKIAENGVTYTLVTASRGEFRSFYSNKKAANAVTDPNRSSATGMLHNDNIPQLSENANGTDGNGRPYYDIPFADSVDAVMNNPYSGMVLFLCVIRRRYLWIWDFQNYRS